MPDLDADDRTFITDQQQECQIYSKYYYTESNKWRRVHFATAFITTILGVLATSSSIVNLLAGSDAGYVNLGLTFVVTLSSGVITATQSQIKQRKAEEAGDSYAYLSRKLSGFLADSTNFSVESILKEFHDRSLKFDAPDPDALLRITTNIRCPNEHSV